MMCFDGAKAAMNALCMSQRDDLCGKKMMLNQ
jgi:hypothetical protein